MTVFVNCPVDCPIVTRIPTWINTMSSERDLELEMIVRQTRLSKQTPLVVIRSSDSEPSCFHIYSTIDLDTELTCI